MGCWDPGRSTSSLALRHEIPSKLRSSPFCVHFLSEATQTKSAGARVAASGSEREGTPELPLCPRAWGSGPLTTAPAKLEWRGGHFGLALGGESGKRKVVQDYDFNCTYIIFYFYNATAGSFVRQAKLPLYFLQALL